MSKEIYDSEEFTFERKGTKRTIVVNEISGYAFSQLAKDLNHQDDARKEQAREAFAFNLIAGTCAENGVALTFEDAKKLPSRVLQGLIEHVNKMNGGTDEAKEEAKKG